MHAGRIHAGRAERAGGGPVFVVGSMRSGSTMLRLILDSHPEIAIGPETGFMRGLRGAKEIPNWQHGKGWYERLGWSESEFDARLDDFYDGIFRRFATEQGKTRWGEKTPFHTTCIPEMAKVFPTATFVGIVRQPGAVATSLHKHFHYTFADAVSYWLATNLDLVRAGSELGTRFAVCRYEDLVLHAEPVLRAAMQHLDESWSSDLLEHHRVQREKGAPRRAEGSTVTREPIDASHVDEWASSMGAGQRQALSSVAELGLFFGYDVLDPESHRPLPANLDERQWLLTGEDLAKRRVEWADRIDFELRPPTLTIEASPQELASQLARAEQALARVRSRRSVRLVDAFRRLQHGRSASDLRDVWAVLRKQRDP
ncbi:MAG: sulfotransferase family protein [Nocardioidaceae bacterium]